MTLNANSLSTNLLVTAMVMMLVLVMPWVDRKICGKLGLNLHGGVSTNPQADRLLKIRQWILTAGIAVYLFIFAWLTFLSRSASESFLVHVSPMEDVKNAFRTDHGFSDVFSRLFTEGFSAFANVRLVRPEDIAQFYMNGMLFVPIGYLLPYTFRWFRERVWTRPVGVCFLLSFFTENMQLLSRRGLYDLDDMISNTLGGLAGQILYIFLAYALTHPGWKAELRASRSWRKKARKRALYPCRQRLRANCTVLQGSDRQAVWDFYVRKLGYRPVRRSREGKEEENILRLSLGQSRIEIRCTGENGTMPEQELRISAAGLPIIREQLRAQGIDPGAYEKDPYTGKRELRFTGPDKVRIIITEAD